MSANQVERARRAWPVLVERASERSTITYGELGRTIGVHHRAIRFVLGVIQDYCLEERLPPLTIIVVNASGKPGNGFIAYDLMYFQDGLGEVYDFDWSSVENPFGFSQYGHSYESLVRTLSDDPDSSEDVYTRVKSRGIKQILFREALLKAYGGRCAFTGISMPESIQACHIVPWAQAGSAERLDVRNGILLNALHHRLFDAGYFTLTVDHRIVYYDPDEEDWPCNEIERPLMSALHGKPMHVPHRRNRRPFAGYIKRHYEIAGWELEDVAI